MLEMITRYKGFRRKKVEQFFKNTRFLKNGKYKFNKTYSCIYLDHKETKMYLKNVIENDSRKKPTFKRKVIKCFIYTGVLKVNDTLTNKEFEGTLYFFSNNDNEEKIFDFKNKKVKLLYNCLSDFENKIATYNYFKPYFNLPFIEKKHNGVIDEDFILFHDHSYSKEMILNDLFNIYLEYFKNLNVKNLEYVALSEEFSSMKFTNDEKNFFQRKFFFDEKENGFPRVKLHGDLRKNNILVERGTGKLYFIDWEFSKHYIFFYDLFYFIYHDTLNNKSSKLLSNYFSGKYDANLLKIFNVFNLSFDGDKKLRYFYIFLFEHYNKKANCDMSLIKKYKKLIKLEVKHEFKT